MTDANQWDSYREGEKADRRREDLFATCVLDEAAKSAFDDIFEAVAFECCFLLTMMMVMVDQGIPIDMMSGRLIDGIRYAVRSPVRGLVLAKNTNFEAEGIPVVRLNFVRPTFFLPTGKIGFRPFVGSTYSVLRPRVC